MKTLKAFWLSSLVLLIGAPASGETFYQSDDFKDGEEIVNVLLTVDEYRLMHEDFERNGQNFDWGWVWTGEASSTADAQPKKKGLKRVFKKRQRRPDSSQLGFDLSTYSTIAIPPFANHSGMMRDGELDEITNGFLEAMKTLGLEVVEGEADLMLEGALVDLNREGGGFGFVQIKPFLEIELRLQDRRANQTLLLLRNQEHSNTPVDAAFNYANQLVLFFR